MAYLTVGTENDLPIDLHYEDVGSGPPVVLIHGWPLSGRSWDRQVPALVDEGYRAITYDRRGFGESSRPWSGYDYNTLAADLHAILQHLELEEVTLVGFSMGGGEVARYLGTYGSASVAGAVLASAVTPYLHKTADHPEGGIDDATIAEFEDGVRTDRFAFVEQFTERFFSAGGEPTVSQAERLAHRNIAVGASQQATLECIGAFARSDFRRDLESFTVPSLVVHGDADAIVPIEVSGALAHELIADSRLVVIEGGPHGCNATHAPEFNRALLDFLAD